MKRIYGIFIATMVTLISNAQYVEDFESFNLSPNSYDNGSLGNGDFQFNEVILNNFYDTSWGGYWSGFAISNVSDDTTSGLANQYGSYAGGGVNNSSNFAVAYSNPVIEGIGNYVISDFKISNNSYAAISMRDGDAFAKKFGSPYDANGVLDGTNGEDFFKVWIICSDVYAGTKDSVEFYLADYRFQDSLDDYIVNTWELVDLSGLNTLVNKIEFRFESSDNGQWGMNTPAYFIIDDITTWPAEGIDELNGVAVTVYPNPFSDQISIQGDEGFLRVYTVNGGLIHSEYNYGTTLLSTANWSEGIYVVELTSDKGTVQQKVIK